MGGLCQATISLQSKVMAEAAELFPQHRSTML
jgi:hypothetical protein